MITLITGGSGSGKSEFAENIAVSFNSKDLIYIATMYPYDEECKKKIERHLNLRKDKNFKTFECYTGLKSLEISKGSTVLLDCISNVIANEMYNEDGAKENTVEEILKGIDSLSSQCENLVIVTNEIYSDGIEYDSETRRYIRYSSEICSEISKRAEGVIEVVYGIPCVIKGGKLNA